MAIAPIIVTIDMSQWYTRVTNYFPQLRNNMPRFYTAILVEMAGRAIDYAMPITRIDTGLLISSYKMTNVVQKGSQYGIIVYNRASQNGKTSYAKYNEYGTSFMAPRLMLTTARERIRAEMPDVVYTTFNLIKEGVDGTYRKRLG